MLGVGGGEELSFFFFFPFFFRGEEGGLKCGFLWPGTSEPAAAGFVYVGLSQCFTSVPPKHRVLVVRCVLWQDLFLKTIWMDGFGTLVILLLLRTIRIVHSHCQDGGVASQDKLALAEARRNILSVVTDGEMLLMKNGKIVQAEPRCRHYIEGMLGQEEEARMLQT